MKALLAIAGVGVVLFGITILKSVVLRQVGVYHSVVWTLALIHSAKYQITIAHHLTNGYPVTLEDLKETLHEIDNMRPYTQDTGSTNGLTRVRQPEWEYILNPIGVPARVRFVRAFVGHRAGWEITSPCAVILVNLYALDAEKKAVVQARGLKKGCSLTVEDLPAFRLSKSKYPGQYGEYVSYIPNPVGVPPEARLDRAWEGLPVGFTLSADY